MKTNRAKTGIKSLAGTRSPRWAFMERFEIPTLDRPLSNYLTRWRIIQTPWFGLYLHRMDAPDSRPTLHDHPWNFTSIILKGGYTEIFNPLPRIGISDNHPRHWKRWSVHRMAATDAHYITRLDATPTWTLLLVGARRRVWGYWDDPAEGLATLVPGARAAASRRLGGMRWTAFDEHPHNDEFNAAMAIRKEANEGTLAQARQRPVGWHRR
jgi:hypothetical protein